MKRRASLLALLFVAVSLSNSGALLAQADQKLPQHNREGYTLLLAMRRWEFAAFTALRR